MHYFELSSRVSSNDILTCDFQSRAIGGLVLHIPSQWPQLFRGLNGAEHANVTDYADPGR